MSRPRAVPLVLALAFGFLAGALAATWFSQFRNRTEPLPGRRLSGTLGSLIPTGRTEMLDDAGPAILQGRPANVEEPMAGAMHQHEQSSMSGDSVPAADGTALEPDPIADLRRRKLTLPIAGTDPLTFKGSFSEVRGNHPHEAVDIPAPRNTPVLAVEDGRIARLFYSKAGGITVYQFDPEEKYVYYYAHLEKYRENLREGNRVHRGEIIAYVGTSGNAPREVPHLHFAIFKLTEARHWWEGTPLDPFEVFR